MKKLLLTLMACMLLQAPAVAQQSRLQKQGTATQLLVDGRPYLILGGELGNSSATCEADIERIFPKLERMGLNTVLVPAYWDLIEPVEGEFDFSLTDKVLQQARTNHLKVIFLWFGAWKNSMSCYAPAWFKQNYRKYPRSQAESGKPLEIASVFSPNVLEADNRAFTRWMKHLAEADKEHGTVLMIQIENEIGMLESARDHSSLADKAFFSPVPEKFLSYLRKNKKQLHPTMLQKWEGQGCRTSGTWSEVFGADIYTDEIFMAYHYAGYVEHLAQSARAIYNVPLYVNAAMNSRNRKPGEYPSAGPLAHLIDAWHCGAPSIDILAPDLYDNGFADWVSRYHLPNNPLFIPEVKLTDNDGVRAYYIFAEHDAIGISPFSIEDGSDKADNTLVRAYRHLHQLTPLLVRHQGRGVMKGLLFDQQQRERIIEWDNQVLTCRHFFTLPWDPRATDGSTWPEGGGFILKLDKHEYLIAGNGIVVEFADKSEKQMAESVKPLGEDGFALVGHGQTEKTEKVGDAPSPSSRKQVKSKVRKRLGLASVEEVEVLPDGTFRRLRTLNGDQTHQGRHVRISVGDFKALHVRLYEYE